ncbi:hypothetical protein [Streptomyces niphimycinicus]|nr:hypothetical protein [Streptomyces niphimycinicus]
MGYFDAQDEPVIGVGEVLAVGLAVQDDVTVVGDGQEFFEVGPWVAA